MPASIQSQLFVSWLHPAEKTPTPSTSLPRLVPARPPSCPVPNDRATQSLGHLGIRDQKPARGCKPALGCRRRQVVQASRPSRRQRRVSMAAPSPYAQLLAAAVAELQRNVAAAEGAAEALVDRLLAAGADRRIALYGVGREGLAMKGFAMRLFHMGLQVRIRACCCVQYVIGGGVHAVGLVPCRPLPSFVSPTTTTTPNAPTDDLRCSPGNHPMHRRLWWER